MKSKRSSLHNLPHRELKSLAKANGVPAIGTYTELAERLEKVLPAATKAQNMGAFVETKRAFSYRYYRLKRGSAKVSEIAKKVAHRDERKDPFRTELRPELTDEPQVYSARLTEDGVLYLAVAFEGDPRLVRDGWRNVEVMPPIVAVVALREDEGVLEIRGRWKKVEVIEDWIGDRHGVSIEHLTFTNAELGRLKRRLHAKLASQTIRPNAGEIGSIRITSSGPGVDLDENRDGQRINEVFAQVGFARRNPGFIFNPTNVRVRANEKEGSFYIPKHATEEEVRILRHGFLVTKGLMATRDFALLEEAPEPPPVKRPKRLTVEKLKDKLERADGLSAGERRTVLSVLRSLQLDQQRRIFPAFWELWLPEWDGEDVAKELTRAGVLERVKEAQCPTCDFIGPAEGFPAECPDCETEIPEGVLYHRLRGFLEPRVSEDSVFKPDLRKMADLYRKVERTREPSLRATNDQKKKALEGFAEFLFGALEGFRCIARNRLKSTGELDRVFRNENTNHALLRKMGLSVSVECKNTADPVSAAEFGTFVGLLEEARAKIGVYISMAGFSGMPDGRRQMVKLSNSVQKARDAHMNRGISVLMLDGEDLERVAAGETSLVSVLWQAYEFVANL